MSAGKLNTIKGVSAYEALKKPKTSGAHRFLQLETAYIKAQNGNSLSDYWQYLENIFGSGFIEKITTYMTGSIFQDNELTLKLTIYDSFDLLRNRVGLTWEEQKAIRVQMTRKNFDYTKLKEQLDHSFILYLLECLDNLSIEKIKEQTSRMLHQLREARNFIEHSGIHTVHTGLSTKLELIIPIFMYRFRNKLISDINKNPELELSAILEGHTS